MLKLVLKVLLTEALGEAYTGSSTFVAAHKCLVLNRTLFRQPFSGPLP